MTSFASTAGAVTSTLNSAVNSANALRNLLGWAAHPHTLTPVAVRPTGVMTGRRNLPPLTGGTDILDFSDME